MAVSRTEAIKRFLIACAPDQSKDLVAMYHSGMECQVNVAQDSGTRVEGDYQGRKWHGWTDGMTTWKSFRIPYNANSEPRYDDPPINFNIEEHAEGVGCTGWEWSTRTSKWVAFDFDSIIGHKAGLTEQQMDEVKQKAHEIPWVTVRKSTSGKGIHLYVFIDSVPTANHNEHAALARAILGKMSAITGFDFAAHVDTCGGNIWIWHRKTAGTDGFTLIKQGEVLKDIPANWRDHVDVVKGVRKRIKVTDVTGNSDAGASEEDELDKLTGQYTRVPLDEEHKKLIKYLEENGCVAWWDADHYMLVTHTIHLKEAHDALELRGTFETKSSHSTPHNCFAYPLAKGGWVVRRFGQGVQEHESWEQDKSGWTKCYFNRNPDLKTAVRMNQGIEHEKGGFLFDKKAGAEAAQRALKAVGIDITIPEWSKHREAEIAYLKDGRMLVKMKAIDGDEPTELAGWYNEKGYWKRVFNAPSTSHDEVDIQSYDDILRHVVTEDGDDAGWSIKSDNMWRNEPLVHIGKSLKSLGFTGTEADLVIGKSVLRAWTIVNMPFQSEYPGNRKWNRDSAQFAVTPSDKDREELSYPTWIKVLKHCGESLNSAIAESKWAKDNGIICGADYLKCWVASMIQSPQEPLPYLFFWGPQNSGKSIFHESLQVLFKGGVARADNALTSPSGFNGEIANKVLCVIEEVDLGKAPTTVYNRIKDWVTSRQLPVHVKNVTPYTVINTTHWVQCANDIHACPIFEGDTRITVIHVGDIPEEDKIPKRELMTALAKEAPDFLRSLLLIELPRSNDRLSIPVIFTEDKFESIEVFRSPVEIFCKAKCFYAPGKKVLLSDFYDAFINWLEPDRRGAFSRIRVGRELPSKFVKGRNYQLSGAPVAIGNMSFTEPDEFDLKKPPYYVLEGKLLQREQKDEDGVHSTGTQEENREGYGSAIPSQAPASGGTVS